MNLKKLRTNVYKFDYCSDVFESSFKTVSVHKSIRGAYKAMKQHRLMKFNEWMKYSNCLRKAYKDTHDRAWRISKTELLE